MQSSRVEFVAAPPTKINMGWLPAKRGTRKSVYRTRGLLWAIKAHQRGDDLVPSRSRPLCLKQACTIDLVKVANRRLDVVTQLDYHPVRGRPVKGYHTRPFFPYFYVATSNMM
ncbi:hypothetical protein EVAR_66785_1 [Eumeta japonica]|uniref:Uncharacterized protein n=1 Tax=Eumeta variegata TaxID=151549 RepID=A0A4C1ZMI7_EUMVA|nr:hypothetical protein EVAR_66785_1 [Eumeta japonica]